MQLSTQKFLICTDVATRKLFLASKFSSPSFVERKPRLSREKFNKTSEQKTMSRKKN